MVIGITPVTALDIAGPTYSDVANQMNTSLANEARDSVSPFLNPAPGLFWILTAFSLVIAAIGLVNALSLNITPHRREVGLRRALGYSER